MPGCSRRCSPIRAVMKTDRLAGLTSAVTAVGAASQDHGAMERCSKGPDSLYVLLSVPSFVFFFYDIPENADTVTNPSLAHPTLPIHPPPPHPAADSCGARLIDAQLCPCLRKIALSECRKCSTPCPIVDKCYSVLRRSDMRTCGPRSPQPADPRPGIQILMGTDVSASI